MEDWEDVEQNSDVGEDAPTQAEAREATGGYDEAEEDIYPGVFYNAQREVESKGLIDIGGLAAWSVSSFKPGFGVNELKADDPDKLWQSDGAQPHFVDLHFSRRVSVERISIYTDYQLDESYTPSRIQVHCGTGIHDLQEVAQLDLSMPRGWTHMMLTEVRPDHIMKTYFVRLVVTANHQNGKDTHIRALKVYSPSKPSILDDSEIEFTTVPMLSETVIR